MIEIPYPDLSTSSLLLVAAVAIGALVKGADWIVDGASGFAYRLGISKVIVGATVVSLGTTSPEAAVSVMAAWSGEPGLALGNAVGSVVADTGLIFGLGCLIAVLPADRFVLNRQGWVQFGAAVLLATLCYGAWVAAGDAAQLSREVGILLLGLLAAYMWMSVRWSQEHAALEVDLKGPADTAVPTPQTSGFPSPWKLLLLTGLGLVVVLVASRVLVGAVTSIAERWGVPEVVIAATLVALGTSLPELATAIVSIAKGHMELLVGNVVGADILNVLFVIGASAAAAPLPVLDLDASIPAIFLYLHLPTMLLILVLFRLFIGRAVRRGTFSRWMGVPLLVVYASYTVLQFALFAGPPAH